MIKASLSSSHNQNSYGITFLIPREHQVPDEEAVERVAGLANPELEHREAKRRRRRQREHRPAATAHATKVDDRIIKQARKNSLPDFIRY